MNTKIITASALAVTVMLSACGKDDSEQKAAAALDAKIDSAINVQNYEEAIALIDSLNKAYPLQVEIRRGTIAKRAQAMEGWSQKRIPELDCNIANCEESIANLEKNFKLVKPSSNLAGYYVSKNDTKDFASCACVQARVNTGDDAQDTPWTLAVNAGKNIALNKIVITLADGSNFAIDAPVSDGTMASIAPERVNELGEYLTEKPQTATATVSGGKGSVNIKLSAADCEAISASWQFATLKDNLRRALIERERLERQLQIARDQKANAPAANND
jgi:hypothetical protein